MKHDPSCPMCRRVAELSQSGGEDPVWRFPHSIAVIGQWQYYGGYCLLMSRTHATELSQLGEDRTAYLQEMALLAEAIGGCFHPHKINYELLGNQVPHLHWHLFPRYLDDPEVKQPVWIALERAQSDRAEQKRLETGRIPHAALREALRGWLTQHGAPTL